MRECSQSFPSFLPVIPQTSFAGLNLHAHTPKGVSHTYTHTRARLFRFLSFFCVILVRTQAWIQCPDLQLFRTRTLVPSVLLTFFLSSPLCPPLSVKHVRVLLSLGCAERIISGVNAGASSPPSRCLCSRWVVLSGFTGCGWDLSTCVIVSPGLSSPSLPVYLSISIPDI